MFSDSPSASAGQHIGTLDGLGDENDNPPADGVATYSFTVPEDGVYQLAIRVIITGGSNSFWLRIPGMATNTTNHASGWVRFNDISDGAAWHWNDVRSSDDGNSVVRFTLSAGTHTLEIARREDGTLLDAIALTKVSTARQPTVSTAKASYSPNKPIIVNFTNTGGNSTDWVGFFLDGDASENYIDFIYLNGAIDGSVTYDAGLSTPGTYNVRLLFNDRYTVEAGNTFTIE